MWSWINGLGLPIAVILLCWIFLGRTRDDTAERVILGWNDLFYCSDAASLDGKKRVTFTEDHSLNFHSENTDEKIKGTWSFDDRSRLYTIFLNGENTTYSLVALKENNTCMLVKGDLGAADLRASWFAAFPENEDDRASDPDDR